MPMRKTEAAEKCAPPSRVLRVNSEASVTATGFLGPALPPFRSSPLTSLETSRALHAAGIDFAELRHPSPLLQATVGGDAVAFDCSLANDLLAT
jgi:hypothetical protein